MPIRKPGGVFIQRVFIPRTWDPTENPHGLSTASPNGPIAYDSREDETTQETQKPDIPHRLHIHR
jgi:hypothetical protein